MKLKAKICLTSILVLTTLNAFAAATLSCADVAVQPFVERTAWKNTDVGRYHVNLVFLNDTYKNVSNLQIAYKLLAGSWVTKLMQSTTSPWVYISNELYLRRYDQLAYQFTFNFNGTQCKTNMFKYIPG